MLTVHTVCTDNLPTGPLAPVLGLVCLSVERPGNTNDNGCSVSGLYSLAGS